MKTKLVLLLTSITLFGCVPNQIDQVVDEVINDSTVIAIDSIRFDSVEVDKGDIVDNLDDTLVINDPVVVVATSNVFKPLFHIDYEQCGTPVVSENSIQFEAGRVRSEGTYRNITKITATVDLSGLRELNWVNASFYMVNGSDEYCDAGNSGSPYCNEIDFLETNGNVATQSTIHLDNRQRYEYAYTHGLFENPCWYQDEMMCCDGDGVINATTINPDEPFNVVTVFEPDYSNMTVTFVQYENEVVVYDFLHHLAAEGSELDNLDGLAESMDRGWKIVASMWQGYSPNPNSSYNYEDEQCKEWSDLCRGIYVISNIEVTAEGEF